MKNNTQSGYIIPLVIALVAILVAGGAYIIYKNETKTIGPGPEGEKQMMNDAVTYALQHQASTTTGASIASTTIYDNVRTNATGGSNTTSTSSAAWKTYTNDQYGFSVQIPSDLLVSNLNPYISFATKAQEQSQVGKSYEILFKQGDDSVQMLAQDATEVDPANLDGITWSVVDEKGGSSEILEYTTSYGPTIFNFLVHKEDVGLLNEVLSTLKFISLPASSTPAISQTYTNNQYGFSINYQTGVAVTVNPNNLGWAQGSSEPGIAIMSIPVTNRSNSWGTGNINIGISTSSAAITDCENPQNDMQTYQNQGNTIINGIVFAHFITYQPAAGQFQSTETYRTVRNNACWAIDLNVDGVETNRLGGSQLTQATADYAQVQNELNADLLTLKFISPSTQTITGITSTGTNFTLTYPAGWVYYKYSCNVDGIAFWPKNSAPVFNSSACSADSFLNSAPITLVTDGQNPQLQLQDQKYAADYQQFTITNN